MLHHQNRVSFITQTAKQLGHAVDVAGMHPGAWFVKDICHAGQGAAHMTHQLEALCLAAGQGCGLPVQGKIRQPNINHACKGERQIVCDGFALRVCNRLQHVSQLCQFHLTQFVDRIARHFTGKCSRIQAFSMAKRTFRRMDIACQPFRRGLTHFRAVPFQQQPAHHIMDAFHLLGYSVSTGLLCTI